MNKVFRFILTVFIIVYFQKVQPQQLLQTFKLQLLEERELICNKTSGNIVIDFTFKGNIFQKSCRKLFLSETTNNNVNRKTLKTKNGFRNKTFVPLSS